MLQFIHILLLMPYREMQMKKIKSTLAKQKNWILAKFVNTEVFSEDDKQLLQQVRKLQTSEINKYLDRNSPFSGIWENIIQTEGDELPEETKA